MQFRKARLEDIEQIQAIESEYYEGFKCPEKTLSSWIKDLAENFIVAEENKKIVGFIFFEFLDEAKAIPFIHDTKNTHKPEGDYVYITEVGVPDSRLELMQKLFDKMVEIVKTKNKKAIVWLTEDTSKEDRRKHDKIEEDLIRGNSFVKKNRVEKWEAYPGHFVDDHWIWIKEL